MPPAAPPASSIVARVDSGVVTPHNAMLSSPKVFGSSCSLVPFDGALDKGGPMCPLWVLRNQKVTCNV